MTVSVRHDVFWASHKCDRIRGHGNPCRCSCGVFLPADVKAFGDDAATAVHALDATGRAR